MVVSTSNDQFNGKFTADSVMVPVCSAVALFNALELLLLIAVTFKKRGSLYFWSLIVATFAVIPYSIGAVLVFFAKGPLILGTILNNFGWIGVVTGQSIVLYSRLHLVLHDRKLLRLILWMIIVDGVVYHVSASVIQYASFDERLGSTVQAASYVVEKFQMTGFFIQEFIISALYVRQILRLFRITSQPNARRIMTELFIINIIIIVLDISLLVMEYRDMRVFEVSYKGAIYSVKLKMEFAILGRLITVVRHDGQAYIQDKNHQRWVNEDHSASQCSPGGVPMKITHRTSIEVKTTPMDNWSSDRASVDSRRPFGNHTTIDSHMIGVANAPDSPNPEQHKLGISDSNE